jgi:hypothetical protein
MRIGEACRGLADEGGRFAGATRRKADMDQQLLHVARTASFSASRAHDGNQIVALSAIWRGERGTWGLRSCVPPEPVTAQVMKISVFIARGICGARPLDW